MEKLDKQEIWNYLYEHHIVQLFDIKKEPHYVIYAIQMIIVGFKTLKEIFPTQ